MQVRRLALALVILAALGWFALGRLGRAPEPLDAPPAQAPKPTDPAPDALDAQPTTRGRNALETVREPTGEAPRSGTPAALPASTAEGGPGLLVRVLDPSGKALPGSRVSYVTFGDGLYTVGMPQPTDANGCWHFTLRPGRTLDLRATDPTARFAPAYAFDVGPEQRTLEMRLEATTAHTLVVVDENATPIERYAWRLLDQRQYESRETGKILLDRDGQLRDSLLRRPETGSFSPTEKDDWTHPGGRAELRVGTLAFALQVVAEEFEQAQAGPFAALDAPSEIRIVLRRLPGIRGRVVREGKGVPGAQVDLLPTPGDGRAVYVDGFPSLIWPWPVAQARTDDDGRFALQLRRTGEYFLRASADGLGSVELGPRRFEVHQGADGLELAIPASGAIEGRILLPDAEPQRGWIVGASRSDGLARSVHTDADGRFRFELLGPGDWILRPTSEDLVPGEIRTISDGDELDRPVPATCVVRAGESTHVEFDLRVKAELSVGFDPAGWEKDKCSGSLDAIGDTFSRKANFEPIGPGRLRAVVDQPGTYRLRLALLGTDGNFNLGIAEEVRLQSGENTWTFEHALGELVLVNTLEVEQWARLRSEFGGTRRASVSVKLAAHEERRLSGLPAGIWALLKRDDGIERDSDIVEVAATKPARLELH